ncbi:dynein regulatory complex subunit 2 [Andrena cerasifolii]|uniref:dynein regulatory complex subunit 2 n=1 Tax=Andrena cerasifolii TaxID=2819439 RepID=UPI0040382CF5
MIRRRKTKSNKFARMNEEERARYIQHRAEFELEAKRRKQQLIAIYTKNKLKREEVFSRLNIVKINEKWRYVLRQIKCQELYENVKRLNETSDRKIKLQNDTIHHLHHELEIADENYRRLQEAHIVLIDTIIGKYAEKFKNLHVTYKLDNIKLNDLIELHLVQNYMEEDCKKIQNNICMKNKILHKELSIRKTQNVINIRNVLYLEEDMASDFVYQSFIKMEYVWKEMNEVISKYEQVTENKKKQYEYLKVQDNTHQLYILQYPKAYIQLQDIIKSLKYSIQILLLSREKRIAKLKVQNIEIKEKIKSITHKLTVIQVIDSLQLKKLTVASNGVLKNLRRIIEKGSVIHEIVRICSSLEPLRFDIKEYFTQTTYTEFSHTNMPRSCNKINKFWKQYNYMEADNILLKKESGKLYLEYKKLKYKLQEYVTTASGISVLQSVALTSI